MVLITIVIHYYILHTVIMISVIMISVLIHYYIYSYIYIYIIVMYQHDHFMMISAVYTQVVLHHSQIHPDAAVFEQANDG